MISVCILTFNEEKRLQQCIDNIKNGVDEIVVIDGFSTDQTIQIARKNNVELFQRNLDGNYGAQRNFAIEKAKGEWIFMLDADELCSDKLAFNLKIITSGTQADGITVLWKNYCDQHLVEVPRKLCLFKRHGFYKDAIHEKVQGLTDIMNLADEQMYLTHYKTREEQTARLTKYKKIILDNLEEAKKSNNSEKLAYYNDMLHRQTEKEIIWLNNYL